MIRAGGGELLSVAVESHAKHRAVMPLQLGRQLTRGETPNLGHAVGSGGGELLAIVAGGHPINCIPMRAPLGESCAVGKFPSADHAAGRRRAISGKQRGVVVRKLQRRHAPVQPGQLAHEH